MVTIEVLGTPGSKGSGRAVMSHGRALYLAGGSAVGAAKLRSWDRAVRDAAREACPLHSTPGGVRFVAQPLRVEIWFRIRRPAGHYGKRGLRPSAPRYPSVKPDLDKLVRATLDPLMGIVFDDDSRVVAITARKVFAGGFDGDEGARIDVEVAS